MRDGVIEHHKFDDNGNPAGGSAQGTGFEIQWQNGPLAVDGIRKEPNGAFVEDVIAAVIGRIQFYQSTKFNCMENELALGHLRLAAGVLDQRTRDRERRGVEGTHGL